MVWREDGDEEQSTIDRCRQSVVVVLAKKRNSNKTENKRREKKIKMNDRSTKLFSQHFHSQKKRKKGKNREREK